MKGRGIIYSADEIGWIEANAARPRAEAHAEFIERFGRADVSAANYKALCTRRGWKTGRTGHFLAGHPPMNEGCKMPYSAGSAATRFRQGQEPHNTRWLGHERVSVDGYVEISVAKPNPHTGYPRSYVLKHLWLWEQANGPVPEGHCLKSRDGDRLNTDPANWMLIPRALLPRLNGGRARKRPTYDEAHPDLKPTVLAVARLEHAANDARRK
jgi:hypothetical protein